MNLKNRDSLGTLIAFVKFGAEHRYCLAPVEYWIGEYWNAYVDLNREPLELGYFKFLDRFKVHYEELYCGYSELIEMNDVFDLEGNKPQLFIDFGKKYFVSYFQEQELERRVSDCWVGKYMKVEDLIPDKFRYWIQPKASA